MKNKIVLKIILFSSLICCKQLPKEKYAQWNQAINYEVKEDSLYIAYTNPLMCPIRLSIKSKDDLTQKNLNQNFPTILSSGVKVNYTYEAKNKTKEDIKLTFYASMGNPNDKVNLKKLNLPFLKGKKYKITQGYKGQFSHNSLYSKYAIDFNLKEKDTICAVEKGYVVGVIEEYKDGGSSRKWRDYANFITVFHPKMNIYSQYVHLTHLGSLVKVGDTVSAGQPIALSGKTGFTTIEHLHLNILKPSKNGMESTPIEFVEGYRGKDLKKGDFVEK